MSVSVGHARPVVIKITKEMLDAAVPAIGDYADGATTREAALRKILEAVFSKSKIEIRFVD